MQLEKTDGPTHPDDITGNDADAGKIPPPKNNGPSAAASGRFRQRTMPRHAHEPHPDCWTGVIHVR